MGEPRVCSAVCCILVQSSVNKNPNFLTRLVAKTSPNSHANCTKEFDPPKTDKYYRELSTIENQLEVIKGSPKITSLPFWCLQRN